MFLIVGLGNPGARYAATRHNIGWMVLDEVARRHGIAITRKQAEAQIGDGSMGEGRVLLAKPLTFMNLSGRAVAALLRFYKIEHSQLLVVCDDLNLPTGKLRLRAAGSNGGHNGLSSVEQSLASRDYARLRVGVGEPPERERRERGTAEYVLSPFPAAERELLAETIGRAADCIETFVQDGVAAAMNRHNG
jgi:PTH1 family peptidyl-tRNA hydrolase